MTHIPPRSNSLTSSLLVLHVLPGDRSKEDPLKHAVGVEIARRLEQRTTWLDDRVGCDYPIGTAPFSTISRYHHCRHEFIFTKFFCIFTKRSSTRCWQNFYYECCDMIVEGLYWEIWPEGSCTRGSSINDSESLWLSITLGGVGRVTPFHTDCSQVVTVIALHALLTAHHGVVAAVFSCFFSRNYCSTASASWLEVGTTEGHDVIVIWKRKTGDHTYVNIVSGFQETDAAVNPPFSQCLRYHDLTVEGSVRILQPESHESYQLGISTRPNTENHISATRGPALSTEMRLVDHRHDRKHTHPQLRCTSNY